VGGAWADVFDEAGRAAPATRAARSVTETWSEAAFEIRDASDLLPYVRRLFIARVSDAEWFFLPPKSKGLGHSEADSAGAESWPHLSTTVADWRWSGPFASMQACVVWSQTTYEGLGSADLKRVESKVS